MWESYFVEYLLYFVFVDDDVMVFCEGDFMVSLCFDGFNLMISEDVWFDVFKCVVVVIVV